MGATGSVVVDLTGFFHSSCLYDASSGENLKNKTKDVWNFQSNYTNMAPPAKRCQQKPKSSQNGKETPKIPNFLPAN